MRKPAAGFSFPETLVVVVLIGFTLGVSATKWHELQLAEDALADTGRIAKAAFERAHSLAIDRGTNHFLVVDPQAKTFSIFEDISTPFEMFNYGDRIVSHVEWPGSVSMRLPTGEALHDPIDGAELSTAWSMPLPDVSARWGPQLIGVMATPSGAMLSAERKPRLIRTGTVVFSDNVAPNEAVGVRIDGRSGKVRLFRRAPEAPEPL